MRTFLATTAAWLLAGTALAADTTQTLRYDLIVDGAVVGSREVSIRYLEPFSETSTESRLIETWTQIDTRVGAWNAQLKNRSTAHITASDSNFTSSMSLNGDVSEVQGRTLYDGRWQVHGIFNRRLSKTTLRRTEVDLSTLDLLDPVRSQHMTTLSEAKVLSAETGEVMAGPVTDLGEETLTIGDETVLVHRYAWSPEEGRFELAWSDDGLLLDWSADLKGRKIHGRLQAMPPARSFGEAAPISGLPSVTEEEL